MAEDNLLNFELLDDLLEAAGYQVDWARDGEDALSMALTGGYALLLLDVHMPRRDGLSVLLELRARGHRLPVAAITADAMPGVREELEAAGAHAFLTKPLDLALLLSTVRSLAAPPASSAG
ncbi:MAG TPA: response regulator [Candidatus Acidoferrales bacterium]|nr:response regulator [Candidatus Acidoferrales bacterium]